jgi:hypothetical protein
MAVKVEQFPTGSATISAAGIYLALDAPGREAGDTARLSIGLDFGPGEEPLWSIEGDVKREGSRTVLELQFGEFVAGKTKHRKVVIDFDYERMDAEGESVALPRVTVE